MKNLNNKKSPSFFYPEAILFDMDDTLVDVTKSYRQTVIETAKAFGVKATFDDISRIKAKGGANNDWECTASILKNNNVSVSLLEITEKFEAIYQGGKNKEGLRLLEKPLFDVDWLNELSEKFSLGIVTGRPRKDAYYFLNKYKIKDLFGVVMTMDDGPEKPDPAPVKNAMQKLKVIKAWMVGDTPDDMVSASKAGALPIGVVAPCEDYENAVITLKRNGAYSVLRNVCELKELLQ